MADDVLDLHPEDNDDATHEGADRQIVHRAARAGRVARCAAEDEAFPSQGLEALHAAGLLLSPFPVALGGEDLAVGRPDALKDVLRTIGHADLALGRLYEGHVNAVALAIRYGSSVNLDCLLAEAQAGRLSGVWMAGAPLQLRPDDAGRLTLTGHKILCSGGGCVRRPLVAADFNNGSVMLLPLVDRKESVDLAGWTVRGMAGSATGTVDFTGISIAPHDLLGEPGDYLRSPFFRGGAWRVLAVQLGGIDAVLQLYREQLNAGAHRDHPVQLARFGCAMIGAETARLWVSRAAAVAEGAFDDPASVDAYVDLARNAFEAAALDVIACAEKAIGLKAFTRPNPMERVIRDLQTYLRQPALDASLASAAAHHLERGR